jgi:hypothetical protein
LLANDGPLEKSRLEELAAAAGLDIDELREWLEAEVERRLNEAPPAAALAAGLRIERDVAVNLMLRNVWTRTGQALTFPFEGADARELRDLLGRLKEDDWIDAETDAAVLIAHDHKGDVWGAWTRNALARLLGLLDANHRAGDVWQDLQAALVDATKTGALGQESD